MRIDWNRACTPANAFGGFNVAEFIHLIEMLCQILHFWHRYCTRQTSWRNRAPAEAEQWTSIILPATSSFLDHQANLVNEREMLMKQTIIDYLSTENLLIFTLKERKLKVCSRSFKGMVNKALKIHMKIIA